MIDSSTSSAESNFRELDEVFLQTQTRIWIGEVLNTRFDEDLHISDLLQDGEILFEVSKVVWNLLLTKCMELRHLKHKYGPFGSKTSSGRYRPYSNVDSFLKICKILGLSGIDLFSPSDVVEKRNIRKVCICIRALSKKARSKQLSVPDFDMVIYSVSMPTDMVGVLRRSLESSSQCTLSSSSSYSYKGSQVKLKKNNLHTPSNRDDESSSEESSDEAESRYMGENSPEAYSISGQHRRDNVIESDVTEVKNGQHRRNGTAEVSSFSFTLDSDDSVVGDSSCMNVGESDYISDYLAFSDLMVHASDGSNRANLGGETSIFDFFLNVDSEGLTSDKRNFQNGSQKKLSDDEDMEVSSTTSMSSVLGRLLNLEFDDQFDEDDSSSSNVYSSEKHGENHISDDFGCNDKSVEEGVRFRQQLQDINVRGFSIQGRIVQENPSEAISDINPCTPAGDHVANGMQDNITSAAENGTQDKKEQVLCIMTESISDEKQCTSPRLPPGKHGRRPLLTTVVKGTAIAGVLFLLLHIRKSNAYNAQENKQHGHVLKFSESKFSSTKQQTGSVGKGVYPAEKIKLGN